MKKIDEPMTHGSWYVRHDLGPVLGPVDPKPFLWYDLRRQMERKEVIIPAVAEAARPAMCMQQDANAFRPALLLY